MGLSKRHLDRNSAPLQFDVAALAGGLQQALPEVLFAILVGSAAGGTVPAHSDLDLALFLRGDAKPDLALYERAAEACEQLVGPVRCDLGILNRAEPVYRFEALRGRLLFCRDSEAWQRFFSLACREYEHQLFDYGRQRRYRLEARQ